MSSKKKAQAQNDLPNSIRELVDNFKDNFDRKSLEEGLTLSFSGQCLIWIGRQLQDRGHEMQLEAGDEE